MPTRILRDGILTSERVACLGWAEECFYRRLMSVADDHGRFYALPALILAACYPLHLKKVSDSDIEKWLHACVGAALVRVYPAKDGKRYLQILDFGQRIQSKSKFPEPVEESPLPAVGHHAMQESTVDHGGSPEVTVNNGLVVVEVVVEKNSLGRQADRFDEFYAVYPKHVKGKPAREKWKAKRLDAKADLIIADVKKRLASDKRWAEGFIPDPTTYLSQERWDDAIETVASTAPNPKSFGPKAAMRESETPLERALGYAKQRYERGEFGTGTEAMNAYKAECQAQTHKHRSMQ